MGVCWVLMMYYYYYTHLKRRASSLFSDRELECEVRLNIINEDSTLIRYSEPIEGAVEGTMEIVIVQNSTH